MSDESGTPTHEKLLELSYKFNQVGEKLVERMTEEQAEKLRAAASEYHMNFGQALALELCGRPSLTGGPGDGDLVLKSVTLTNLIFSMLAKAYDENVLYLVAPKEAAYNKGAADAFEKMGATTLAKLCR